VTARVRAAVVGCGDISTVHLAALHDLEQVDLVGVCDVDQERASSAAAAHGVPAYTDFRAMLDALRPDVVHVCTPHDQHAPVAVECIGRGIHVVLEKPVAHTLAAAQPVVEASRANPAVKVAVCFQNRYNRAAQEAYRLIAGGSLGAVRGALATVAWHRTSEYYARGPWRGQRARSGGGVLMNQAIHTLDLLQWFVGPVTDVRGTVATLALPHVIEVEDTAALRLRHRTATGDTVSSVFHATNGHVENAPVTVEIVTEHARLRLDTDLTVAHDDGRVETFHPATAASGERAYWGASHGLLIDDFYRHVRAGKRFWIDAPAALESLRVIQAVYDQRPRTSTSTARR
jgi:predicted dehydrogenase